MNDSERSLTRSRTSLLLVSLGALTALIPSRVFAQAAEPAAPTEEPRGPAPGAQSSPDKAASAAAPSTAPGPTDRMAAAERAIAEQARQIEELTKKLGEVAANPPQAPAPVDVAKESPLKIYGFMEAGFHKTWTDPTSPAATYVNSIPKNFMIGGFNTYFDVTPSPDWRGLLEVRFTTAPNGEIANLGGLAGTFKRVSTQQMDPNGGSLNAPMWGSYIALERAHIDWTRYQALKIRSGMFFTPFGIWNVDHGSPTLIPISLPQLIVGTLLPIRQLGIQAFGNVFAGNWELGYMATVSNGRQEQSAVALTDDVGLGGRIYAADESGDVSMRFGASFYTGRNQDLQVDVTNASPVTLVQKYNWAYREYIGGVDASFDIHHTRIRSEVLLRRVDYDTGKHAPAVGLFAPPGAKYASSLVQDGYVLVAQQLPWAGIEPWAMLEGVYGPSGVCDTIIFATGGINVHLSDSLLFKSEVNRTSLLNLRNDPAVDGATIAKNNATLVQARLVLTY